MASERALYINAFSEKGAYPYARPLYQIDWSFVPNDLVAP